MEASPRDPLVNKIRQTAALPRHLVVAAHHRQHRNADLVRVGTNVLDRIVQLYSDLEQVDGVSIGIY